MSDIGQTLNGTKIMWVEDDKFLSEMIAKKLRDHGAELEFTETGEGAVEKMRDVQPDLLLLDILLPVKSGFEILEEMKQDDQLKDVPVILFSNLGQQEDIDKGYNLGADKFLVKATVDLENVVDEIAEMLGDIDHDSQAEEPSLPQSEDDQRDDGESDDGAEGESEEGDEQSR